MLARVVGERHPRVARIRSSFLPKPSDVVNVTVPASRSRRPTGATAVTTAPPAGVTKASAAVRSPVMISSIRRAMDGICGKLRKRNGRRSRDVKVLVTGASGLIGSALVAALDAGGHEVVRLAPDADAGPGRVRWDPAAGDVDPRALEGADAVVHLAGETVAGRWTDVKKRRILREPRVGTRLVAERSPARDRRRGCSSAPPRSASTASAATSRWTRADARATTSWPTW